tara:strand:- start:53 stop:877 length:825 start_codon:yes stop_codon:yes gene_type:complete
MTIDKRILYRHGGDTMGGPNDRSRKGPGGPPGGGATSMGSGRDFSNTSSNTNPNVSGGGGQDPMPVTPVIDMLPSNIPIESKATTVISNDPLDFREQYRIGNFPTTGLNPLVTYDGPYRSEALARQAYDNMIAAKNLSNYQYEKANVPLYMPGGILMNTVGNLIGGLGHEINVKHFAKNVAGNYGYGYGIEDYKRYMKDRNNRKVDAFGNPENSQNAIDARGRLREKTGIMEVASIAPTGGGASSQEDITEDLTEDMYFNFGTGAQPIYKKDLV